MSQLEFLGYHALMPAAKLRGGSTYRVIGGPPTFRVTFYKADDLTDEELERREQLARDVIAVKPLRRPGRVKPERARALIEAAGGRALAEADRATPEELATSKGRKWLVRIYYWSEGGELLCFDAGPYHRQTADRVAGEHAARVDFVPDEKPRRKARKLEDMYRPRQADPPGAEVFDRDEIGADAIAQDRVRRPARGARLVVLPSQQSNPVESCEDTK